MSEDQDFSERTRVKISPKDVEDIIAKLIYEILTKQSFHDFYMDASPTSFEAHICGDTDCPTKEEIVKKIKVLFGRVINEAKSLAR